MGDRGQEAAEKTETWTVTAKIHDVTVPNTLRAAIVARIDRLTEDARYALQTASVIGREFRLELLRNLIEAQTEIDVWLSQLERGDLVRPEEINATLTYTFLDAMVREVAYESLLVQNRAQIHDRIGAVLEELFEGKLEQKSAIIAYHYSRGNNVEKALTFLTMAAKEARDEYANETAIQHFEQMLAFQRKLGARADQAHTLYEMGMLAYEIGDYERARPWLSASIELYEDLEDQENASWAIMYVGMVDLKQGDYPSAMQRHELALKLARDRNDTKQEGIHLTNLARTIKLLGDYDRALKMFDQSLELKEANNDQKGQGFVHYYQGMIHLEQGRYEEATHALERVFDIWSTMSKSARYMSFYHYGMGNLALAQEQCEEALEHLQEALAISERLMLGAEIIEDLSALGQVSLCLNDIDAAIAYSSRAIKLLESQKDVEEMQRIYLNHYDVLKATDASDADHYFRQARRVMRAQAELIQDETARATYLTGVPVNQRITSNT
jgi:tetratricopeptide (TPR) repeat protein